MFRGLASALCRCRGRLARWNKRPLTRTSRLVYEALSWSCDRVAGRARV